MGVLVAEGEKGETWTLEQKTKVHNYTTCCVNINSATGRQQGINEKSLLGRKNRSEHRIAQ